MAPEFLLTSLVVVALPGTGVLVTLAAGLSRGARAAVVAAFGCTLGIVPHRLAAVTGLAALLHTSALAFQLIKYAGLAYLLYTAWMTLKEHGPLKVEADDAPRSDCQVIVSAILVNVLNPKLSILFLAYLPQFVSLDEGNPLPRMVKLSLAFMAMTFAVLALRGVFAAAVRTHVASRPRGLAWMRQASAAALALGARLAAAER